MPPLANHSIAADKGYRTHALPLLGGRLCGASPRGGRVAHGGALLELEARRRVLLAADIPIDLRAGRGRVDAEVHCLRRGLGARLQKQTWLTKRVLLARMISEAMPSTLASRSYSLIILQGSKHHLAHLDGRCQSELVRTP